MKSKKRKTPKKIPKIPDSSEIRVDKLVEECMIEYGTYVNEQRHIPDFRDGLKPVQRRVLWTMLEDGHKWDGRFTKCAAIVGDTLARYHPHGDIACYGALVGMTGAPTKEDKNIFYGPHWTYPTIEGYGNFGTIDGEPGPKMYGAAAMRYPECKLSILSQYLFNLKPTVQLVPNYLNTRQEPLFLPSSFPFLLLNGVSGIAVGVSTDMPPHNLGEICNVLIVCLKKKKVPKVETLMKYLKGPDWTYGGSIWDKKELAEVYKTGKGSITWCLQTEVEKKGKRWVITIKGIPPRVSLKKYLMKLAGEKDVKAIRNIETSENLEIEVEVISEKMMEKIVYQRFPAKNDWNVTIRESETEIKFKHVDLRTYLDMWLKYCVGTHKEYFQLEIDRLKREIRNDSLRILAFENINKVIALIKKENDKGLMKLLKCTQEEVDIIKRILLGSLAKTNEATIRKRIASKKKEMKVLNGHLKKTEAYLIDFFRSCKKYSRERATSFVE